MSETHHLEGYWHCEGTEKNGDDLVGSKLLGGRRCGTALYGSRWRGTVEEACPRCASGSCALTCENLGTKSSLNSPGGADARTVIRARSLGVHLVHEPAQEYVRGCESEPAMVMFAFSCSPSMNAPRCVVGARLRPGSHSAGGRGAGTVRTVDGADHGICGRLRERAARADESESENERKKKERERRQTREKRREKRE